MYNNYYGNADIMGFGTALLGLGFGIMIFSLIISLITIISYWKIFTKAGKPGWASIIPVYNMIVMLEIAKLPLWYIALFFIPIANIYAIFKIYIEIAKKFGKTSAFGIGMTFLGVIFIPLLAFSDSVYDGTNNENTNVEDNSNIKSPVMETIPVQEPIAPVMEPTIPVQEPVAPVMETTPVQEPIAPVMEPTTLVQEPVAPVMEPTTLVQEPVAPVMESTTPVQEPIAPVIEPTILVQEPEVPNAFNSTAIVNNETSINSIADVSADTIVQNLTQNIDANKKCKNCGNELPDIVSICPNCGTDNE